MANIKGITIEIGGNTTKLVAALKDVNRNIKDTQNGLKEIDKLLKLDPTNTDLLRQKQGLLKDAIKSTEQKLKDEKTALEQLKNAPSTEQTKKQQEALTVEITKTEQQLKKLKNEYVAFGTIAGAQLKAIGGKMQTAGRQITQAGYMLAPYSAIATGLGAAAGGKYASVDKTMQLTNATMKNTVEEAEMLNKAMREAAANSTFGMSDAATATLNFARAGLDAKEASAALAPAMNLAAGEGGDLILKALEKFQKSLYRDFEKFLINHISFSSANAKNVQ